MCSVQSVRVDENPVATCMRDTALLELQPFCIHLEIPTSMSTLPSVCFSGPKRFHTSKTREAAVPAHLKAAWKLMIQGWSSGRPCGCAWSFPKILRTTSPHHHHYLHRHIQVRVISSFHPEHSWKLCPQHDAHCQSISSMPMFLCELNVSW